MLRSKGLKSKQMPLARPAPGVCRPAPPTPTSSSSILLLANRCAPPTPVALVLLLRDAPTLLESEVLQESVPRSPAPALAPLPLAGVGIGVVVVVVVVTLRPWAPPPLLLSPLLPAASPPAPPAAPAAGASLSIITSSMRSSALVTVQRATLPSDEMDRKARGSLGAR